MAKPKPILILGSVVGVLIIASAVILPWYFLVYRNQLSNYPTWDLKFYGDPVVQNVNMTYEYIRSYDLTLLYNETRFVFNQTNDGESSLVNFTGVAVWDLIVNSSVDYGSANALRFVGIDGTMSPEISLEDVENNTTLIMVYYIEGESLLKGPPNGEGYLASAVDFTIDISKNSSLYNIRGLVGIEFLTL